jgi:transcriptional regulator with XRE-family HTH domain
MADLINTFARRLRQAREERDWTQEDLADHVGLSVRYIGKIERRQASPTITVLGRLADALDIDPGDLVRRKSPGK